MKWLWLCVVFVLGLQWTHATDSTDDIDFLIEKIVSIENEINLQRQLNNQKVKQLESVIADLKEKIRQLELTSGTSGNQTSSTELKKTCPERIDTLLTCTWIDSYGCYCFTFDRVYKTLNEAYKICRDNGMELLSIETAGEQAKIIDILNKQLDGKGSFEAEFWMSGSDEEKEGTWKWVTTGQPISFFHWEQGEPNNSGGKEDFMAFSRFPPFEWLDYPKTWDGQEWSRNFICEKPA